MQYVLLLVVDDELNKIDEIAVLHQSYDIDDDIDEIEQIDEQQPDEAEVELDMLRGGIEHIDILVDELAVFDNDLNDEIDIDVVLVLVAIEMFDDDEVERDDNDEMLIIIDDELQFDEVDLLYV